MARSRRTNAADASPKDSAPAPVETPVAQATEALTTPEDTKTSLVDVKAITTPVTLGDSLVDVRYFDGGDWTMDLHLAEGIARFVNGVARVTPEMALVLRDRGYVKPEEA